MTPERWHRLKSLFEGAAGQPVAARAEWLAAACGADSTLERQVERLLAADISTADLEACGDPTDLVPPSAEAPASIGRYRIARTLHVGVTASVYLAIHRGEGEGFERRVALKVAHRALDHAASLRFDLERRILASLEHPNIARLYDGGRTQDGRTYLAMELVEGVSIDRDCDQRKIGTSARLALFVKVCTAVQYAHQNLVVHRDLKPGNILVDGRGAPKLLDFGIAKLLNPELSAGEMVSTAPSLRPMTPRYASPEQVEGGAITTAVDVYSLGVLLYELLTGHTPYRLASRDQAVVARAILEQEPRPTHLARDLDAIVRKAMDKVPARRYGSAAALAEDIGRHLRHEPVRARPRTLGYRAARFVRRHRLAALLVAAVTALALIMAGQSLELRRALDASRVAEAAAGRERARAEAVSRFLVELFEHADPEVARGETVDARRLVDRAAARIAVELPHQPQTRAALTDTLGLVYRNLGLHQKALEMMQSALALRRSIAAPPADVASSLEHLSWQRYALGDFAAAETPAREALALRRESGDAIAVAGSLHNLAELVHAQGRYDEAEELYREALALRRRWLGAEHEDVGESLLELAFLDFDRGDTAAGEAAVAEALKILNHRLGPRHPKVAAAIAVRGMLEKQRGDLTAAIASQRQALALRRELLGVHHPDTLSSLAALGLTLFENGEGEAAVQALEEALEQQRQRLGARHPMVGTTLNDLGLALGLVGRHEEAIAALERARSIYSDQLGEAHPSITVVTRNLAKAHEAAGDLDAAVRLYAEVAARYRRHHPKDTAGLAQAEAALARVKELE